MIFPEYNALLLRGDPRIEQAIKMEMDKPEGSTFTVKEIKTEQTPIVSTEKSGQPPPVVIVGHDNKTAVPGGRGTSSTKLGDNSFSPTNVLPRLSYQNDSDGPSEPNHFTAIWQKVRSMHDFCTFSREDHHMNIRSEVFRRLPTGNLSEAHIVDSIQMPIYTAGTVFHRMPMQFGPAIEIGTFQPKDVSQLNSGGMVDSKKFTSTLTSLLRIPNPNMTSLQKLADCWNLCTVKHDMSSLYAKLMCVSLYVHYLSVDGTPLNGLRYVHMNSDLVTIDMLDVNQATVENLSYPLYQNRLVFTEECGRIPQFDGILNFLSGDQWPYVPQANRRHIPALAYSPPAIPITLMHRTPLQNNTAAMPIWTATQWRSYATALAKARNEYNDLVEGTEMAMEWINRRRFTRLASTIASQPDEVSPANFGLWATARSRQLSRYNLLLDEKETIIRSRIEMSDAPSGREPDRSQRRYDIYGQIITSDNIEGNDDEPPSPPQRPRTIINPEPGIFHRTQVQPRLFGTPIVDSVRFPHAAKIDESIQSIPIPSFMSASLDPWKKALIIINQFESKFATQDSVTRQIPVPITKEGQLAKPTPDEAIAYKNAKKRLISMPSDMITTMEFPAQYVPEGASFRARDYTINEVERIRELEELLAVTEVPIPYTSISPWFEIYPEEWPMPQDYNYLYRYIKCYSPTDIPITSEYTTFTIMTLDHLLQMSAVLGGLIGAFTQTYWCSMNAIGPVLDTFWLGTPGPILARVWGIQNNLIKLPESVSFNGNAPIFNAVITNIALSTGVRIYVFWRQNRSWNNGPDSVNHMGRHNGYAARYENEVPSQFNILSIDRIVNLRPLEWGMTGMNPKCAIRNEWRENDIEDNKGWLSVLGCHDYRKTAAEQEKFSLVAYGNHVLNAIHQYLELPEPLNVNFSSYACNKASLLDLNMNINFRTFIIPRYITELCIFEPAKFRTYDWDQDRVFAPMIMTRANPRIPLKKILALDYNTMGLGHTSLYKEADEFVDLACGVRTLPRQRGQRRSAVPEKPENSDTPITFEGSTKARTVQMSGLSNSDVAHHISKNIHIASGKANEQSGP